VFEAHGERGELVFVARRDAGVRLEILDRAGDVRVDLACDGDAATLVDRERGCVTTGPCDATLLRRYLHIRPIAPDLLIDLAAATPAVETSRGAFDADLRWDEHGLLDLALWGKEIRGETLMIEQEVALDPRTHDVRELTQESWNRPVYRVEYRDFVPARDDRGAPLRIPRGTRVEAGSDDVRLAWREVAANVPVRASAFHLAPPPGLPVCR
jgi:hypothetical protein